MAAERIPLRYPFDRVHSPLTPAIAQRLRDIAKRDATLRSDVFAKVGDSITFSDDSYRCLAKQDRNLGTHAALGPVIRRFAGKPEYGTNPYSRDSLTAQIGWSAWQVLSGEPSPLAKELKAIRPRIALVQFGTNDIEIGAIFHFADQLWNIVDYLAERGVVPVLFTIPPRKDKLKAGGLGASLQRGNSRDRPGAERTLGGLPLGVGQIAGRRLGQRWHPPDDLPRSARARRL